ncbi:hypothetical protein BJX65DRAFT_291236 [Aspergillus insuetus]
MASIYFRNTRSGKKSNRQPRPRQFKFGLPAVGPYGLRPSACGAEVLGELASGLAGRAVVLDVDIREHIVLGSWMGSGMSCVAFTKVPELVSAMVGIRGVDSDDVNDAVTTVCTENPGANAPNVIEHTKDHRIGGRMARHTVIQVSGRLAPHVSDAVRAKHGDSAKREVTFCNATQARLCFCITTPTGTHVRTLSPGALHMLAQTFPSWSTCIPQPTAAYCKIVCEPEASNFRSTPNKNSCCMLYADGRMRFQGNVRDCRRVAAALRESIATMMTDQDCKQFLCRLAPHELCDEEGAELATLASETTSVRGSYRG